MSLYIADPNSVNTVNQEYNGMPTYENMYIDVSLTAQAKNRSTLYVSNDNKANVNVKTINETSTGSVNFLGFNQNTTNYTNKFFTTNYYDESTGDDIQYESFGIESIKITTNSSFIPQVSIKFVDVRGLSFFNQEKSPYRILFDFPPPTFNLRVKGFYGKTIEYLLHLVKYTSEFKAENGNFYIDADFVAITFAPLSDVLFRYVVNSAIINEPVVLSGGNSKPQNTFELISRTQELYTKLEKNIKYRSEFAEFETLKSGVENINACINFIIKEWTEPNESNKLGNPELFFGIQTNDKNMYQSILRGRYNDIQSLIDLKLGGDPSVENKEVYIGYEVEEDTDYETNNSLKKLEYITYLNKFIISLNNIYRTPVVLSYNDVKFSDLLPSTGETIFVCIKLTPLLVELNNQLVSKQNQMIVLSNETNKIVNDAISDILNIKPTIYNIFEIILKDVNTFFEKLQNVSREADKHHNETDNEKAIRNSIASYEDKNHIYPFPNVIDVQYNGWTSQQVLVSPKKISDKLDKPFPEMVFVDEFLKTFAEQAVVEDNIMNRQNDDGTMVWIPNTPLNSNLFSDDSGYVFQNPYDGKQVESDILKALLNRFYVISQYSNYEDFYDEKGGVDYAAIYGEAEATNLVASIDNTTTIDSLIKYFSGYNSGNLELFYNEIAKYSSNYNRIENNTVMANGFDYSNNSNENSSPVIAISKSSDSYIGCVILENKPNEIVEPTEGPMKKFFDKNKAKWYSLIKKQTVSIVDNNLILYNDNSDDINKSWFLNNKELSLIIGTYYKQENVLIKNFLNNVNISTNAKALFILSMFGGYLSSPNEIFKVAAIYEIPNFYLSLIGSMFIGDVSSLSVVLDLYNSFGDDTIYNEEYFLNIIAQFTFVESINDINIFKTQYYNFIEYDYPVVLQSILDMLNENIDKTYVKQLVSGGKYYNYITNRLMKRKYLVLTTNRVFKENVNERYFSIQELNVSTNSTTYKKINRIFFESFLSMINTLLADRKSNLTEADKKVKAIINDEDIINQTYFSFKKIHDKWLTGPESNVTGYPFKRGDNLIDSFIFVDRAMNPIGDTVINPEPLVDLFNDPNATLLTVLSQLLSSNYFEFFPLQNFMVGNKNFLEEGFKMDTSGLVDTKPCFVCMYIGGYSQYDSIQSDNGFNNDGIKSLDELNGLPDFQGEDENKLFENISKTNSDLYKNVKAFKVNFGTQNQSMFTDIKVDSKEFPETNEAIQILSRLAGDESKTAPIPKGQNLYNLYENRAYSATISGLGNAMIQPTQYFEINNIPLYYGVYLILNVEHTISNNFMKTSFTGTKVAKYPKKRVTDACALVQYDGNIAQALSYTSGDITAAPNYNLSSVFKKADFGTVVFDEGNSFRSSKRPQHQGIDLSTKSKIIDVLAAHDGILTVRVSNSFGKYVEIENDNINVKGKFTTRYAHLSAYAIDSKTNKEYEVGYKYPVKAGNVIGKVGNTGDSDGIHLHLELIVDGKVYNPQPSLSSSMHEIFDK